MEYTKAIQSDGEPALAPLYFFWGKASCMYRVYQCTMDNGVYLTGNRTPPNSLPHTSSETWSNNVMWWIYRLNRTGSIKSVDLK